MTNAFAVQMFATQLRMLLQQEGCLIDELEELLEPHAERLDCLDELRHLRTIYHRGTSAHTQVKIYEQALAEGSDEAAALRRVTLWLIEETQA